LIEGELKQEQLILAMRESEAGSRNLDWSILDSLMFGTTKLFSDLNSLQDAIDETRRAKERAT